MTNTYIRIFACVVFACGTYSVADGQVKLKDHEPNKDELLIITSNKGPDPLVLSKIPLIENYDMSLQRFNNTVIDPKSWKRISKLDSINSIQALEKRTSDTLSVNRVLLLMKEKGETKSGSINRWQVAPTKP